MAGGKTLEQIEITLRDIGNGDKLRVYIDVLDNSLAPRWLHALEHLLAQDYHLEKNYCFMGWPQSQRDGQFILHKVNETIQAINASDVGYKIHDHFSMVNCMEQGPVGDGLPGRKLIHHRLNQLHRYFEETQGVSGCMSQVAQRASPEIRWHIRQLNLLCHEFESWALSYRKWAYAPEWTRPSQLMCWLNAPRFLLEPCDLELFGIDTINRRLGGVYVGVNKAVGKHHWEVFQDEGRDSRLGELTTTTLRSQTEAAGDFDIEWARDPGAHHWQQQQLAEFRAWLTANGFDPQDPALTIGHPQVAQVNLDLTFGTEDYQAIWARLATYLDVWSVRTSSSYREYDYHWSDADFAQRQIAIIGSGS
jgi:hypothetical protein